MTADRKIVLVLCTGNICRSPMAEHLLRHALAAENPPLSGLEVVSAGTAAGFGEPASDNSVAALRKVGLDLSRHKSQPLSQTLIDQSAFIFGMTQSHLDTAAHYYKNLPEHCFLLRQFVGGGASDQIPDPYGQDFDAYVASLNSMIEAIPSVVTRLKELA